MHVVTARESRYPVYTTHTRWPDVMLFVGPAAQPDFFYGFQYFSPTFILPQPRRPRVAHIRIPCPGQISALLSGIASRKCGEISGVTAPMILRRGTVKYPPSFLCTFSSPNLSFPAKLLFYFYASESVTLVISHSLLSVHFIHRSPFVTFLYILFKCHFLSPAQKSL